MEELCLAALDQIALEGRQGCTLPRLWQVLGGELPIAGIMTLAPQRLRAALWSTLLASPTLPADLKLLLPSPADAEGTGGEPGPSSGQAAGRQPPQQQNKDTAALLEAGLLREVSVGDPVVQDLGAAEAAGLRLLASLPMQLMAVGIAEESFRLSGATPMSETQLRMLELTGTTRRSGSVQVTLASRMGIKHQNFFHVVKDLEERRLVKRIPAFWPSGSSHIVYLTRFAPALPPGHRVKLSVPGKGFKLLGTELDKRAQLTALLADAPQQAMLDMDLRDALALGGVEQYKEFKRFRDKLVESGHVEVVMVQQHAIKRGEVDESKVLSKRGLKLVRQFRPEEEDRAGAGGAIKADPDAEDEEDAEGGGAGDGGISTKLLAEQALERQVLAWLLARGDKGMTSVELAKRLGLNSKAHAARMRDLMRRYGIRSVTLNKGRVSMTQLMLPRNVADALRKHIAPPPSELIGEGDGSEDGGREDVEEVAGVAGPLSQRRIPRPAAAAGAAATATAAAAAEAGATGRGPLTDADLVAMTIQARQRRLKQGSRREAAEDEGGGGPQARAAGEDDGDEEFDMEAYNQALLQLKGDARKNTLDAFGKPMINLQSIRRIKYLLNKLREEQVLLQIGLRQLFTEAERGVRLDHRTIIRLVDIAKLMGAMEMHTVKVLVPMKGTADINDGPIRGQQLPPPRQKELVVYTKPGTTIDREFLRTTRAAYIRYRTVLDAAIRMFTGKFQADKRGLSSIKHIELPTSVPAGGQQKQRQPRNQEQEPDGQQQQQHVTDFMAIQINNGFAMARMVRLRETHKHLCRMVGLAGCQRVLPMPTAAAVAAQGEEGQGVGAAAKGGGTALEEVDAEAATRQHEGRAAAPDAKRLYYISAAQASVPGPEPRLQRQQQHEEEEEERVPDAAAAMADGLLPLQGVDRPRATRLPANALQYCFTAQDALQYMDVGMHMQVVGCRLPWENKQDLHTLCSSGKRIGDLDPATRAKVVDDSAPLRLQRLCHFLFRLGLLDRVVEARDGGADAALRAGGLASEALGSADGLGVGDGGEERYMVRLDLAIEEPFKQPQQQQQQPIQQPSEAAGLAIETGATEGAAAEVATRGGGGAGGAGGGGVSVGPDGRRLVEEGGRVVAVDRTMVLPNGSLVDIALHRFTTTTHESLDGYWKMLQWLAVFKGDLLSELRRYPDAPFQLRACPELPAGRVWGVQRAIQKAEMMQLHRRLDEVEAAMAGASGDTTNARSGPSTSAAAAASSGHAAGGISVGGGLRPGGGTGGAGGIGAGGSTGGAGGTVGTGWSWVAEAAGGRCVLDWRTCRDVSEQLNVPFQQVCAAAAKRRRAFLNYKPRGRRPPVVRSKRLIPSQIQKLRSVGIVLPKLLPRQVQLQQQQPVQQEGEEGPPKKKRRRTVKKKEPKPKCEPRPRGGPGVPRPGMIPRKHMKRGWTAEEDTKWMTALVRWVTHHGAEAPPSNSAAPPPFNIVTLPWEEAGGLPRGRDVPLLKRRVQKVKLAERCRAVLGPLLEVAREVHRRGTVRPPPRPTATARNAGGDDEGGGTGQPQRQQHQQQQGAGVSAPAAAAALVAGPSQPVAGSAVTGVKRVREEGEGGQPGTGGGSRQQEGGGVAQAPDYEEGGAAGSGSEGGGSPRAKRSKHALGGGAEEASVGSGQQHATPQGGREGQQGDGAAAPTAATVAAAAPVAVGDVAVGAAIPPEWTEGVDLSMCPDGFIYEPGSEEDRACLEQLKVLLAKLIDIAPRRPSLKPKKSTLPTKRSVKAPPEQGAGLRRVQDLPSQEGAAEEVEEEEGASLQQQQKLRVTGVSYMAAPPRRKAALPPSRMQPRDAIMPPAGQKLLPATLSAQQQQQQAPATPGSGAIPAAVAAASTAAVTVAAAAGPSSTPGPSPSLEKVDLAAIKAWDGSLLLPVANVMRMVQSLSVSLLDASLSERAAADKRRAEVLASRFGKTDVARGMELLRMLGAVNPRGGPRPYELSDAYRSSLAVLDFPDDIYEQAAAAASQRLPLDRSAAAAASATAAATAAAAPSPRPGRVRITAGCDLTGGLLAEISGRLAQRTLDLEPVDVQGQPLGAGAGGSDRHAASSVSLGTLLVSMDVTAEATEPPGGSSSLASCRPRPLTASDLAQDTQRAVQEVAADEGARGRAERDACGHLERLHGMTSRQAEEEVQAALSEVRAAGEQGAAIVNLSSAAAAALRMQGLAVAVNGYESSRLVAAEYAGRYLLPVEDPSRHCLAMWPWLQPDGRLNESMWGRLLRRVVTAVVRNPGIPESRLLLYCEALGPADSAALLDLLLAGAHLEARTVFVTVRGQGGPVAAFANREVPLQVAERCFYPGSGALFSSANVGGGSSVGLGPTAAAAAAAAMHAQA